MGKKRKLEDREIQKTVAREKILNISKRKLKKVKIFNTLYMNKPLLSGTWVVLFVEPLGTATSTKYII